MLNEETTIKLKKDTHAEMTRQMGKETYDEYVRKLLKLAKRHKKDMEMIT